MTKFERFEENAEQNLFVLHPGQFDTIANRHNEPLTFRMVAHQLHLSCLRVMKAPLRRPTKGRTLDHIGLEVRNLREFSRLLAASGVKLHQPYTAEGKPGDGTPHRPVGHVD